MIVRSFDHVRQRWGRLTFQLKIAISYSIVVVILVGSLVVFGVDQAAREDQAADDYTRQAVRSALITRSKSFASWLKGYALWDDAYTHMVLAADTPWADANIGPRVWKTFTMPMRGVFVIDARNAVSYRYWPGGDAPSIRAFQVDLARLRAQADATPDPVIIPIVHDGHPYFYGIARIRAMDPALARQPAPARYLVLLQPVEPLFAEIEASTVIDGLRWASRLDDPAASGLDLFGPQGRIVWTPHRPGMAMLAAARGPALLLTAFAGVIGIAQYSMARGLAGLLQRQRLQAAADAASSCAARALAETAEGEARSLMCQLREQEAAVHRLSAEREAERERRRELARAQSLATLSRFEAEFDTVLDPLSEIAGTLNMQATELRREAAAGRTASSVVLDATRASLAAIEMVVDGNRALDDATKGLDADINRAVSSTRQVEHHIDDLLSHLTELGAHGAAVDRSVVTVASLARRINMLALNARIEASHAGDAGRGFAIVADEVKQLAMLTRDATVSITDLLRSMQANTETAKAGITAMRPAIGEVVELTSLSRSALDRQTRITLGIIDAVEKARARVSETDVAMRNLDQVLGSSERLGASLQDAAEELDQRSTQLQVSSNQFSEGLRNAGEDSRKAENRVVPGAIQSRGRLRA